MGHDKVAKDLEAALAHHRAGRLERAQELYRKILRKVPDHPDALHMLGVIANDRGHPERAIQLIGKALEAFPGFADAHLNLGNAYARAGRAVDAVGCYRRAIALKPGFAMAHSSLARALNASRDFASALASARQALALAPAMAEAHFHQAHALYNLGILDEAEIAYRGALALDPDNATFLAGLGFLLIERSRFADAVVCYRRVAELQPRNARAHRMLATARFRSGETEAALSDYRRAVALDPGFADGWNGYGWALRALGRFDEARECFRRALAIDPARGEIHRSLATTGARSSDPVEIERLSRLLDVPETAAADRIAAGFALGEMLDAAGRFDEAFARYAEANELARAGLAAAGRGFDAAALASRVDRLIATFTPTVVAREAAKHAPSELPVFIVGMPRSGTTLVEQILSSHSRVFGGGELPDIVHIAAALEAQCPSAIGSERWSEVAGNLADAHRARLRALGGDAVRVTDKTPDNIFYLGMIAAVFPGARVIFCRRDPRDLCLSNYFQLFAGGNPYSYDLADCGRRFRETERLAAYWRTALPLRMHEVRYEALVADLDGESRRLVAFLELDWEPACLDFHRNERVVVTQSTWQVRQPLYASSVGRWRPYERHLGALFDVLGDSPE